MIDLQKMLEKLKRASIMINKRKIYSVDTSECTAEFYRQNIKN